MVLGGTLQTTGKRLIIARSQVRGLPALSKAVGHRSVGACFVCSAVIPGGSCGWALAPGGDHDHEHIAMRWLGGELEEAVGVGLGGRADPDQLWVDLADAEVEEVLVSSVARASAKSRFVRFVPSGCVGPLGGLPRRLGRLPRRRAQGHGRRGAARRDTAAADERGAHAMPGREEGGEDGSGGQGDPAE
jgi:hypothetical protein